MRHKALPPYRLIPMAMACLAAFGASAHASTFYVDSCDDSPSAINTYGTLRYAVANASSGDTIDLSIVPALTSCPASTITLQQGELVVAQPILTFQGSTTSPVTISGDMKSRVFHQEAASSGSMSINYLTIENGKYLGEQAFGGCISSNGAVRLNHSMVTGCLARQSSGTNTSAKARGGGIYASGVALVNSLVSGNRADASYDANSGGAYGGGIYSSGDVSVYYSTIDGNRAIPLAGHFKGSAGGAFVIGNLSISNSTISNNYGVKVGGILQSGATTNSATIRNSTFSGNTSSLKIPYNVGTGGVQADSPATISNSTIAGNAGMFVGGLAAESGLVLQSSIVADNSNTSTSGTADLYLNGGSAGLSGGNDLVMSSNAPLPSGTLSSNPQLCRLANHGGATQTLALQRTSPAIRNGANPDNLPTDQRGNGFSRSSNLGIPITGWTDIGAYQRQWTNGVDSDDEIFCDGFASLPSG